MIIPTRSESAAALSSLPGARPEPGSEVPVWRAGDLLIIEPGMGPDSTIAILPYLEAWEPAKVWLFGWCGGLRPELGAGDLVLADATIVQQGGGTPNWVLHPPSDSLLAEVRHLAEGLGVRMVQGPVLSSGEVLRSVAQKRVAAAAGAVAVEMEAGPLACWTAERCLPFAHLRVVLDPLESALPPADLPTDERGYIRKRTALFHALTHPREWPALCRLFRQAYTARRVMTDVIAALSRPGGPLSHQWLSERSRVRH